MKTRKAPIHEKDKYCAGPLCDCKPQHTPTPWMEVGTGNIYSGCGCAGTLTVAESIKPEDAAFIVRAINSHEKLVKALKLCQELNGELRRRLDDEHWFASDIDKIDSAISDVLAQAEGGK